MFKPLLAAKADLSRIKYPVLASPKLDGIRCLMIDGVAYSRTMKPIPNQYIQKMLAGLHGLDGELMLEEGDYNAVQSAVMRRDGVPNFVYHVFDNFDNPGPFADRLRWCEDAELENIFVEHVDHNTVMDETQLMGLHEQFIAAGYEGTMIRDPNGRYKNGRSTVREGILLKLKNFSQAEGVIVDIIEKMHNTNVAETDELGYTKRSSAKANLRHAGTAGAVVVRWEVPLELSMASLEYAIMDKKPTKTIDFSLGFGPGLDDAWKKDFWENREDYFGRTVTFSYQELSKDGVPRFGKMLGFRTEDDL